MEISFSNQKLAKLLNRATDVLRTYGPDNGKRILTRLTQIAAAETPRKPDGGLDWAKITRVKILRIDDPH